MKHVVQLDGVSVDVDLPDGSIIEAQRDKNGLSVIVFRLSDCRRYGIYAEPQYTTADCLPEMVERAGQWARHELE